MPGVAVEEPPGRGRGGAPVPEAQAERGERLEQQWVRRVGAEARLEGLAGQGPHAELGGLVLCVFFFWGGGWKKREAWSEKASRIGEKEEKEKRNKTLFLASLTSVPSLCHVTTSVPAPPGPEAASAAFAKRPRALVASPSSEEDARSCASARSAAERTAAASEEVAAAAAAAAAPPPSLLPSAATATMRGSARRASKASCWLR